MLIIPTSTLGYKYDIQLESWSNKLHGFQKLGQERYPLDGGLGLGVDVLAQFDTEGWIDTIPRDLLEASQSYPEYQYQMLWLAANCKPAKQILVSRPMVLALVCDRCKVDNEKAQEICNKLGQKDILSILGYDGTKAALKFIDKLRLKFDHGDEVEHVKRMLNPITKRYLKLRHYSQIDYNALRLDQAFPFLSGSRLATSLIQQGSIVKNISYRDLQDSLTLGIYLNISDPIKVIANQRSVEAFDALHDRWARRHNLNLSNDRNSKIDWDKPYDLYLQGNDYIRPILSFRELKNEGEEQHHCIAIYHSKITAGAYCAFQMQDPQRLTIGVKRNFQSKFPFEIDQISGKNNRRDISEQSREIIKNWFEQAKIAYLAKSNDE